MAAFSGDKNMLDAYYNDIDIHSLTASYTNGMSYEDFMKLEKTEKKTKRNLAKIKNFGLIYKMSANGFKNHLRTEHRINISDQESRKEVKLFFKQYPQVVDYHKKIINKGKVNGSVQTLFGRKRHLLEINSEKNGWKDEKKAINSPIQGTCGELTIFAIGLLSEVLPEEIKIVNTIHDSIMFYIPKHRNHIEDLRSIKWVMDALPIKRFFGVELPNNMTMKTDAEISDVSWYDLKEIDIPSLFEDAY